MADITDMVTGNGLLDGSLQAVERALTQTPVSYTHLDVYKRQALSRRHHGL